MVAGRINTANTVSHDLLSWLLLFHYFQMASLASILH